MYYYVHLSLSHIQQEICLGYKFTLIVSHHRAWIKSEYLDDVSRDAGFVRPQGKEVVKPKDLPLLLVISGYRCEVPLGILCCHGNTGKLLKGRKKCEKICSFLSPQVNKINREKNINHVLLYFYYFYLFYLLPSYIFSCKAH